MVDIESLTQITGFDRGERTINSAERTERKPDQQRNTQTRQNKISLENIAVANNGDLHINCIFSGFFVCEKIIAKSQGERFLNNILLILMYAF